MNLPSLLSVVIVIRNEAPRLESIVRRVASDLSDVSTDWELIVVDNGSTDSSVDVLRRLTGAQGVPNVQVYCLTREVEFDCAAWAGIANALGDFVIVLDPLRDDSSFLPMMMQTAVGGVDVVFVENLAPRSGRGLLHSLASGTFLRMYRWFQGVDLQHDAPGFRVLSRRIVNFLMQHPVPALSYRLLPATAGFRKQNLSYLSQPLGNSGASLWADFNRAIRLLVSSTRGPMRLVTSLSLFGAMANIVYSAYVIAIFIVKRNLAPGWVTLSLQQSGMFLLISLVLLVLGEYILHMTALSSEGPRYYVAQEFTSAVQTRRNRLNVEEMHVMIRSARDQASISAA